MHGLEVLRTIRRAQLPTRVVVFTAAIDDDEMVDALRLDARGVVLKERSPGVLLQKASAPSTPADEQGAELLALLREADAWKHVPVVILSCPRRSARSSASAHRQPASLTAGWFE